MLTIHHHTISHLSAWHVHWISTSDTFTSHIPSIPDIQTRLLTNASTLIQADSPLSLSGAWPKTTCVPNSLSNSGITTWSFCGRFTAYLILARQEDGYIFRFDALDLTLLDAHVGKVSLFPPIFLWKNVRDRCIRAWKSCNMVCTFHLCSYEHHIWVQVWTCENPCASMTKGTLHTFQRVIWSKLFVEPSPVDHTEAKWQAARKGKPAGQGKSRNPSGSLGAYCKFTVSISDPKLNAIPESDLRPWQSPYEDSSAIQIIKQISSRAPQSEKDATNNFS